MTDSLVAQFTRRFPSGAVIEGRLKLPARGFSCTVLFGPSGCGKTTILRCLAGLERPQTGSIRFGSETWFDSQSGTFQTTQQRQVGFVFQDYALFPHLTVAENVDYGLHGLRPRERAERVTQILGRLGLRGLERRSIRQISGGEQQRVALARSLVRQPRLLLLDEPLAALDSALRAQVRRELRATLEQFDVPTVVVTHNRLEALALADTVVVLDEGLVLQNGPAVDVFARPANAVVARIVGVDTVLPATARSVDGELTSAKVGKSELFTRQANPGVEQLCACIRAECVELISPSSGDPDEINTLHGRVVSFVDEGALWRIEIDCGFQLAAVVTRAEFNRMELARGKEVSVHIDPNEIQLLPAHGERTTVGDGPA